MARMGLKERISRGVFLLDGAMGTQLFARGIEAGKCNDYLNIESPDIILDIQKAYIKAGSDAVLDQHIRCKQNYFSSSRSWR